MELKMSILNYLMEKLVSSDYEKTMAGENIWLKVFKNPDTAEVIAAMKSEDDDLQCVRGLAVGNGDIYVWNCNVYHENMIKKMFKNQEILFIFSLEYGKKWLQTYSDEYAFSEIDDDIQQKIIKNLEKGFSNIADVLLFHNENLDKNLLGSIKYNMKTGEIKYISR